MGLSSYLTYKAHTMPLTGRCDLRMAFFFPLTFRGSLFLKLQFGNLPRKSVQEVGKMGYMLYLGKGKSAVVKICLHTVFAYCPHAVCKQIFYLSRFSYIKMQPSHLQTDHTPAVDKIVTSANTLFSRQIIQTGVRQSPYQRLANGAGLTPYANKRIKCLAIIKAGVTPLYYLLITP